MKNLTEGELIEELAFEKTRMVNRNQRIRELMAENDRSVDRISALATHLIQLNVIAEDVLAELHAREAVSDG